MTFQLADVWSFLQKLSPIKVLNIVQVWTSFHLSRLLKKPIQWGMPYSISIEPTTACNLRCPECPSGLRAFSRPTGNLKQDFFRSTIDQNHQRLLYLIFYFQGEPYINTQFLDMVEYASKKKIYTITSTNGHFLDDERVKRTITSGLDRLIISVDGTTQEVYQQYRKEGNLKTVLEGARNVIRWKKKLQSKKPYVIFQFLVVRPNEHQIEDIKRLGREIGVDEVKLKTAQIYDYKNGHDLIPTIDKYSRYRRADNGKYKLKHELLNQCWKLWHSCVITWDGKVVPCCFDKDASHQLGSLQQSSLMEIWQGTSYHRFRKQIFKGRSEIDICNNCTEGCKVWA